MNRQMMMKEYDGETRIKVIVEKSLVHNTASNNAHISIQWGSITASAAGFTTINHREALEWGTRVSKFRLYRIDALDIEFNPLRGVSGSTEKSMTRVLYATSIEETFDRLTSINFLEESVAFKKHDPTEYFKIHVNVGKYFKNN